MSTTAGGQLVDVAEVQHLAAAIHPERVRYYSECCGGDDDPPAPVTDRDVVRCLRLRTTDGSLSWHYLLPMTDRIIHQQHPSANRDVWWLPGRPPLFRLH